MSMWLWPGVSIKIMCAFLQALCIPHVFIYIEILAAKYWNMCLLALIGSLLGNSNSQAWHSRNLCPCAV